MTTVAKTRSKMPAGDRRRAILVAARNVFVEKGFERATVRELAEAAGVSEALLFKHFPNKEALYSAIHLSSFKEEGSKVIERLQGMEPSTATLVFLVRDLVSHILGRQPEEGERSFLRLVLRSLMDEGGFARQGIQEGPPSHWVRKVGECLEAARHAGDIVDGPASADLGGWCIHHLVSGFLMHFLPAEPVITYGIPREELVEQVTLFCLRGIGLKEELVRRSSTAVQCGHTEACL
jgi:AcrR family transcriptional regulator